MKSRAICQLSLLPLLIGAMLCFQGCGPDADDSESSNEQSSNESTNGDSANESRGTIGYSALTFTNEFFLVIADNMEEEAAKHGFDLIRVAGERDVNKQADQIRTFIDQNVSAIVLNPCDSKSIGPAIKAANEAGIPVFTNDIKYDGDVGEVVCHIATDNYQGGLLAGQAMVDLIGDTGGEVVILHFPQVESCQLRVQGFNEVVDKHNAVEENNKIEVVMTLDGGGMRDEGYQATSDAIQAHPDLAAIFAINDPSAIGAYLALSAVGMQDQVEIIGFDGQPDGKLAILEGKIHCDPIQFPDQIGRTTIEQIIKYFDGEDIEPEVLIESSLYFQADAMADPDVKAEDN